MKNQSSPLIAIVLLLSAATSPSSALANEKLRAVTNALEKRDCSVAVRELNAALPGADPSTFMLAGAMFEQGLCLKPNAERAARLYMRADEGGATGAKSRLAALYAAGDSDAAKGSTMWWALQAKFPMPAACGVPVDAAQSVEKFSAFIGQWPIPLLGACVYVAGVIASLDADFELKSVEPSPSGINLDFRPAAGQLNVTFTPKTSLFADTSVRVTTTNNVVGGNNVTQSADPAQLRIQQEQEAFATIAAQAETNAKAALKRFIKPDGIDPSWRLRMALTQVRER